MGFKQAPDMPPATTTIPVVSETADTDTADAYEQSNSRRKGLLSTILSSRREQKQTAAEGNTTLG